MEMQEFLHAWRRFWYVFAAFVVVGIGGALIYDNITYLDEAKTSVAVLSPLASSKTTGSAEAQVSFDAIINSDALASRVAARMGEPEQTVVNNLSVSIYSGTGSSATNALSPLYIVHGYDHGRSRAALLVSTAVQEATQIYIRLNGTDGSDIKTGLATQQAQVQQGVAAAQGALGQFEKANNAYDLPNRIAAQRSQVGQLTVMLDQSQASVAGDQAAGGSRTSSAYPYDQAKSSSLATQLSADQKELDRLTGLLPEWNRLDTNVSAAEGQLADFYRENQSLLINTILPAEVQIKLLDTAVEESQLLTQLLVIGIGLACGLLLGLGAVYGLARIYPRPAGIDEVATAFRAPVLVRIPRKRVS